MYTVLMREITKKWYFWALIGIVAGLIVAIFRVDSGNTGMPERFTALGTLILASATVLLVLHNDILDKQRRKDERDREERDRKERRLKEILDWTVEIKYASLVEVPSNPNVDVKVAVEFNKQMNHAKALARGETIIHIALYSFKNELLEEVQTVIDDLTVVMFLEYSIDSNIKDGFQGRALKTINMVEVRINNKEKRDDLFKEYAVKLANSTNILSNKISELMSKL